MKGNKPTLIVYAVKDPLGVEQKAIWTRIGAAWPNKSGKGFNITWEYLPLGEGLTVMLPYNKQEQDTHLVSDEYPA